MSVKSQGTNRVYVTLPAEVIHELDRLSGMSGKPRSYCLRQLILAGAIAIRNAQEKRREELKNEQEQLSRHKEVI